MNPAAVRAPTFIGESAAMTACMDATAEPVREGVYWRAFPGGPYSCWSQGRWYGDAPTPDTAAAERKLSRHPQLPWAGLALPSSSPCLMCRGQGVRDLGFDEETGNDLIDDCPECI